MFLLMVVVLTQKWMLLHGPKKQYLGAGEILLTSMDRMEQKMDMILN